MASAARCMRRQPRATWPRCCCWTARTCRKRTRAAPTATATRATPRRCRCTRGATRSAPSPASCRCRRARDALCGKVRIGFTPVGHLLGACAVTLTPGGERLVFSGDLGRSNDLLMPRAADGAAMPTCCWSNRPTATARTRRTTRRRSWRRSSRDTVQRGGSVLLPAFAVGRAQALMLVLQRLKAAGEIPRRPAGVPGQPDGDRGHRAVPQAPPAAARERARGRSPGRRRAHGRRCRGSRCGWCARAGRASSSRPAAWPPAGACCTT